MESNGVLRVTSISNGQLLSVMDRQYGQLCLGMWWWQRAGTRPDFSTDTPSTLDYGSFASEAVVRKFQINSEVYLCNGWDRNRIWDGKVLRDAGEDRAPTPTIAVGSGTGLTGSYTAVYTYYDSARDFETCPCATAPAVIALTNQSLAVSVVASTNPRFDKIRIYRNVTGVPATYKRDQTVANATATIQSTNSDTTLTATDAVSYSNFRPPVCKYVIKTSTRIFWAGSRPWVTGTANVTNGSATVSFSEAPPPDLYTRNSSWPFYFQIQGGPRYLINSISGATATLSTTYQETTATGQSFVIVGPQTRVAFADLSSVGWPKIESWNPNNWFNLGLTGDASGKDFQEEIRGLREYGRGVYAPLAESWWFFDTSLRDKRATGAAMGCVCDKTIVEDKDKNLVFVGSDMQVYAFNGSSTVMISGKMQNRFAKASRYNLDLMEFAHAYKDLKEDYIVFYRPAAAATIGNMKYVVDVYDDKRGDWMDRESIRLMATCEVEDETHRLILGIDTLGLVHQIDNYEDSSTFGDDLFTAVTPTIFTSVAGEISPGSNKQGSVVVVFTSTTIKGSKLITNTASTSAATDDLGTAFTVAAGDSYMVGAWHSIFETGWMDLDMPNFFKSVHFWTGTLIKGSSGYLYFTVYGDESPTSAATFRVDMQTERFHKRSCLVRGRQVKFKIEMVTELVGAALRDGSLWVHPQGGV